MIPYARSPCHNERSCTWRKNWPPYYTRDGQFVVSCGGRFLLFSFSMFFFGPGLIEVLKQLLLFFGFEYHPCYPRCYRCYEDSRAVLHKLSLYRAVLLAYPPHKGYS